MSWFHAAQSYQRNAGYQEFVPFICGLMRDQAKRDVQKKTRYIELMKENAASLDDSLVYGFV